MNTSTTPVSTPDQPIALDAVIVGAGFSGMYQLLSLRDKLGLKVRVLEAADGDLQAYAILAIGADEAHLLNLCVVPRCQGRGFGRSLLRRMIELARWHHADRIFLEVRPSNPAAIALYASEGFSQIGRRPRYYPAKDGREDALVMALELGSPEPAAPR